jgi:hypothetical protein
LEPRVELKARVSGFTDFENDVISRLELVADANIVFVHIRRGYILTERPCLVELWFRRLFGLPNRVVFWVVLVHRTFGSTVSTSGVFVPFHTGQTAERRPMVLGFVDRRGDLSSKEMLLDFPSPDLQKSFFLWDRGVL